MSSYYHPLDNRHPLVTLLTALLQHQNSRYLGPPEHEQPGYGIPPGPGFLGPPVPRPIESGNYVPKNPDLSYKTRQQSGQFSPPSMAPAITPSASLIPVDSLYRHPSTDLLGLFDPSRQPYIWPPSAY